MQQVIVKESDSGGSLSKLLDFEKLR